MRDLLRGVTPADWDLCTGARPEQTRALFADCPTLIAGMRHGTVTVLTPEGPVEITTFRSDGPYGDGRHPDSVTFVPTLEQDLARRDFTVNAMALAPDGAVIDLAGGQEDLAAGLIRCVGEPEQRFREDGLRLLRALRFASRLDFSLEAATERALLACRGLLDAIARERIWTELQGLLLGPRAGRVLRKYAPVIFQVLPALAPLEGFLPYSPYHIHDGWTHTALAVDAAPPEPVSRLAMLLHDVGKPAVFFLDAQGRGHAPGHGERGARMAEEILRGLHGDRKTIRAVSELIRFHDHTPPQTEKEMRRWLGEIGPVRMQQLLDCWRADQADREDSVREKNGAVIARAQDMLTRLLSRKGECFSLSMLAVKGEDILTLGVREGPEVGKILAELLRLVREEEIPNEREALLEKAAGWVQREPEGRKDPFPGG